jgi:magnesium chelatase subunit D
MRLVKGATSGVLERSFKNGDEVAIIVFRGTSAQMLLEPSRTLHDAITALEYLPTGGRTPLAHALDLARSYINFTTVLVLVTDGRANVALGPGNAWEEALEIARQISAPALVVDTEGGAQLLGNSRHLAEALCAEYVSLDHFVNCSDFVLSLQRTKVTSQL